MDGRAQLDVSGEVANNSCVKRAANIFWLSFFFLFLLGGALIALFSHTESKS